MTTILFADQCAYMRAYFQHELEDEGYRVVLARDGEEAIDVAASEHPDLAVFDIWMPPVNGLEVAERIAATDPGMRVIFFTNCDDLCLGDPRSALAAACVERSYDLSELKRAITSVLASRNGKRRYRLGLPPTQRREPAMAVAGCASA